MIIRCSSINILVGHVAPPKKKISNRRNDNNEKKVHTILTPTSRYQQPYVSPAPIYQFIATLPPLLAYQTLYPPPLVYHPQQYPTNRPNANHQQNRLHGNPKRNSKKVTWSFTLPEPLS